MAAEAKRFYVEVPPLLTAGREKALHDVEKPLPFVDSSNFHDYLFRQRPRASCAIIAPHLVLPDFERAMRAIAEYDGPIPAHPDVQSSRLMRKGDIFPRPSPIAESLLEPEVGRSLYYDASLQAIRAAPIIVGNEEEVGHDMKEHLDRGDEPMFLGHRHDEDLLGSEDDTVPHIESPYKTGEPWIKASMIILPRYQILQLVTAETIPVMSKEEVDNYLAHWRKRSIEVQKRETVGLKALWDANPHDELAERRYRDAQYAADHQVRIEQMRSTGLLYYVGTDFKNFKRWDLAA